MGVAQRPGGAIVVTGGTGGLGLGVCGVLQETGRPLVVTWVVERELERAREALGPDADLRTSTWRRGTPRWGSTCARRR